jgi:hypothetical protein
MITFKVDTSAIEKMANELEHIDTAVPISRALNRAGDAATTQVGRILAQEVGLGVRRVRESVRVSPSTPGHLTYEIVVSGRHIPLSEFAPRETRKGVSARPWGKRRVFGGAFILPGTEDVAVRQTAERLPLRRLFGPSLAVEAERSEALHKAVEDVVNETFARRFAHELSRMMPGVKSGRGD